MTRQVYVGIVMRMLERLRVTRASLGLIGNCLSALRLCLVVYSAELYEFVAIELCHCISELY
jgi:hypothetical protein